MDSITNLTVGAPATHEIAHEVLSLKTITGHSPLLNLLRQYAEITRPAGSWYATNPYPNYSWPTGNRNLKKCCETEQLVALKVLDRLHYMSYLKKTTAGSHVATTGD